MKRRNLSGAGLHNFRPERVIRAFERAGQTVDKRKSSDQSEHKGLRFPPLPFLVLEELARAHARKRQPGESAVTEVCRWASEYIEALKEGKGGTLEEIAYRGRKGTFGKDMRSLRNSDLAFKVERVRIIGETPGWREAANHVASIEGIHSRTVERAYQDTKKNWNDLYGKRIIPSSFQQEALYRSMEFLRDMDHGMLRPNWQELFADAVARYRRLRDVHLFL